MSRTRTTASQGNDPVDRAGASDRTALLELHAQERRAHLTGDADLLTASMADHLWEASRGGLTRLTRAEVRDRFAAYFASMSYSVWDDLQPPHVAIAGDGLCAWMAVEIEARIKVRDDSGDERDAAFESSWISVYEKHDGRWLMTGISSSVVARS